MLPGVLVADRKGVIRSVNDDVCRTFGYGNKHELLGKDIKILMEKAYRDQHDSYMDRFLQTGKAKVIGTTRVVVGVTKQGNPIKLRLGLSYVQSETDPLFCAIVEEVVDHSFFLTCDAQGKILSVERDPFPTTGYSAESLVGKNVSVLCPLAVSQRHDQYMRSYAGASKSKIIGKVRNLECRHADGRTFPISLEVTEESSHPLVFAANITEVEGTTEAIISVASNGNIVSVSDSCKTLFGYEAHELVGQNIKLISPNVQMREGQNVVSCQHKDGSNFFLTVDISGFTLDGQSAYRGVIRRLMSAKAAKAKSATDDYIFSGDILGWYEITKTLGSGYFGKVKMAVHRLTKLSVAVKTLKKKQYEEAGMVYPPREVDLIRRLNHPNICRLYDTIRTEEALYMITEVIPGGELFDYVAQKDHLSEDEARSIMRQLVSATDYMHRSGIVHRDLKMENVLMDSNGIVKVIDLGLGNFFDASGKHLLNTFCGSADYAAPELWKGLKYKGPEVDVWSLGVILFVITTGFIPFNDSSHVMQIRYHWPKARKFSDSLKALCDLIFQPSEMRATMEDVIEHPWINDGGRLPRITRIPIKGSDAQVDPGVMGEMELLGFNRKDVQVALLQDAHNQITTTYYLLLHQQELKEAEKEREQAKNKRMKGPESKEEHHPEPAPHVERHDSKHNKQSHSEPHVSAGHSTSDRAQHCIIF